MKLSWACRKGFLSVFTIYGHGGHLDEPSVTICTNLQSPLPEGSTRRLKKISPGVSEELFKGVDRRRTGGRRRTTDGKWSQQLILSELNSFFQSFRRRVSIYCHSWYQIIELTEISVQRSVVQRPWIESRTSCLPWLDSREKILSI